MFLDYLPSLRLSRHTLGYPINGIVGLGCDLYFHVFYLKKFFFCDIAYTKT